ncbi:MAG: type IV pilus twitching motility protein PilT [Proteobacteria bacterium]|jgi:twitching motility protein PilT|nr:type IV pilus twitching motility protein PilT [Pseudomonadota bacterium]
MAYSLNTLLRTMIEQGASDLHLTVGAPPAFRVNGQLYRSKSQILMPEDTQSLCYSLLTDEQKRKFEEKKELDFAFGVKNVARLRANIFIQRGAIAGVFRRIPSEVPNLEDLGFGSHVQGLTEKPNGLVLVTGATGSGKSTTLAAFLNSINKSKRYHIITIEDPIEFTHKHATSLVNQREIGPDCESFGTAIRQALREDPDVLMVGEMRDQETAEATLRAAETGHLVFSTLHTNGAVQSINRLIQMFPHDRQDYIRTLLSFTLEAILSQALVETIDKSRRVMVYEYLALTPAIRNLIREDKLHQVYSQMQIGQEIHGMTTMNQGLARFVQQGVVSLDQAFSWSPDTEELERLTSKNSGRKIA